MKQRQTMNWKGTGRPPKFVDPEWVLRLASDGATDAEIATRAGVTIETLRSHFEDLLDRARFRFTIPLWLKLLELAYSGHFRALVLCLELSNPEEFVTKRGRWKQLPQEARMREMLRFFGHVRNARATWKLHSSRQTRRTSPWKSTKRDIWKRNIFRHAFRPSPWYKRALELSAGWFGPTRKN